MKLISSRKIKSRIALVLLLSFWISNTISFFSPSAIAAITISSPSAGTCFQHSGTVSNGALVTIYSLGTIQINLTAAEVNPGQDNIANIGTTTGFAQATKNGSISNSGDIIGNIFSILPPTGTNFVIVPGFQDTTGGRSNLLSSINATISNAVSTDSTASGADSSLGINVGVVTTGTSGIGRTIIAIARDADSTGSGASAEIYPKSGTGNNLVTISITGLGIAVPPTGEGLLSGTLQATLDPTPPAGIGFSGSQNNSSVASAIPGLSGVFNICTVTSPQGQLEAILDSDNDSSDLYDKSPISLNLIALGQIGSNTTVQVLDTTTSNSSSSINSAVDIEPILIQGSSGVGSSTRDQVISTGALFSDIDSTSETPLLSGLDIPSIFGNSIIAPITITFSDDNAIASTSLKAVDIILSSSTPGSLPQASGFSPSQTQRHGFLGALRAAYFETNNSSFLGFPLGTSWGIASVRGDTLGTQESALASYGFTPVGSNMSAFGNNEEPFNHNFVDLRLSCDGTTPSAGWFAILNSHSSTIGISPASNQLIKRSLAGTKTFASTTYLYTQALTNITGTTTSSRFIAGNSDSTTGNNAILYASCSNNSLTLVPIQNGYDGVKDIIAISPKLTVSNVSNSFPSDVTILAQVSGNNLTGVTTINLAKLAGVPITGMDGQISVQGIALAENGQLGINCSSSGQNSTILNTITNGSFDSIVSSACTSGSIAPAPSFFTGGTSITNGGSSTVQGESRGVLIKELSSTSFTEIVNQIGGGTQGTVFEVQLPTGCDVIDDKDDNNTASSTLLGGNDVSRFTLTTTTGVSASFSGTGFGDAATTSSNAIIPAINNTPAKLHFNINSFSGQDSVVNDAILVRIDSQDLFCPVGITGDLKSTVIVQNKVNNPTVTLNLGNAILGTATQALSIGFADDLATSIRGETSTNTMIGVTPTLLGANSNSHTIKISELAQRAIPIGERVSARNLDPENSLLSTVLTKGQLWLIPTSTTLFKAAPSASDILFSDTSLLIDGNPILVTDSTVDSKAPIGSIIIGVKRNIDSNAIDPMTVSTTITIRNLKLGPISNNSTLSAEFFSQDAGVVSNTPGAAAGNNSTSPTAFTPFAPGSTKALTQLNTTGLQLESNNILSSRLTALGTPQLNPFTNSLFSIMNADNTKIGLFSTIPLSTDLKITVSGIAGAVDNGAEVLVTTGTTTNPYDSVTVVSSDDGSFIARVRGDCSSSMSVIVSVSEQVSGIITIPITRTFNCQIKSLCDENCILNEIAGTDGKVSSEELLSYIRNQGGLAPIISEGGVKLSGIIKAAKAVLGLS